MNFIKSNLGIFIFVLLLCSFQVKSEELKKLSKEHEFVHFRKFKKMKSTIKFTSANKNKLINIWIKGAKDASATKYATITFDEVFQKKLNIIDLTALTLCQENNLPIKVFNMNVGGNLAKICKGENVGTLVNFK